MADAPKNLVIKVEVEPGIDLSTVVGTEYVWYNPETDEDEIRPKTLGDLVAEKMANTLIANLDNTTRNDMVAEIRTLRQKLIIERILPSLEEGLTRPIKLTNTFGEFTGKEVTITELIVDEGKKALMVRGDRHSTSADSLLVKVIREQVTIALTRELNGALAEAKATIVKAVKEKAAEYLTEATLGKRTR